MTWLAWIAASAAALLMAAAIFPRLVSDDPGRWHVDPLEAPSTGRPNEYRIAPEGLATVPVDAPSPVFAASADDLAAAFDAYALAQPRTQRIAGGPEIRWATYVQRSRVFGFPDYVSARFIDLDDETAAPAVFSRARFGSSDLGVNRARVENWLAALEGFGR